MNNWTIAGRVGGNAEIRYTGGGQAVANFSVAVDQGKDSSGNKRKPLWVRVAIWGERAEKLAQYIKKGSAVTVSGRASVEKPWQQRDGSWTANITLDMNQISFQSSKRDSADGGEEEETQTTPAANQEITDEDIPF